MRLQHQGFVARGIYQPRARRAGKCARDYPRHLVHREGDAAEAVGRTVIETSGISHTIQFVVDHVTNEPRVTHTIAPSSIATGTRLTIQWPVNLYGLVNGQFFEAEDSFKDLARSYAWFNPHLTLRGVWDGVDFVDVRTSNPHWTKWRPSDSTSPHRYTPARLQRYLSAHVARDRQLGQDRPVREFIVEFRGLSGTRKQKEILAEIGASRQSLGNFFWRNSRQSSGDREIARGHEEAFRAGLEMKALISSTPPIPG